MKSKLKALLGIALTLVLLASLTVGLSVPAAADPGKLKFSNLVLPKVGPTGDYWAYPSSDVGAIDVAADGETLFAAVEDDDGWQVMKSTDGGYSWKATTFTDDGTDVVDVAVSPDYEEDLTVLVATKDYVYQSVDGGKRFVCMDDTPIWAGETITDLDVALDERGRLAYMVGTSSAEWVDVELEKSDDATAEWSTGQKTSGSYSALLSTDASGNAARVVLPWNQNLSTITDMGYAYRMKEGHGGAGWDAAPYMIFELDTTGNGAKDTWVIHHMFTDAADVDVWTDWELADDADISDPDAPGSATPYDHWVTGSETEHWFAAGTKTDGSPYADWAAVKAVFDAYTVLKVKVAVGEWASNIVTAYYVDDITINGVTYQLEDDPDPEADPLVGVAYTILGDVYVLSTATGMSWQPQEIGAYNVLAAGFSPFFADDEGISAVVSDSTSTEVRFSFAHVGEDLPDLGWDKDIGDAGISDALGHPFPSRHARIAFPDDFDAFGIDNNICFVGIDAGSETDPDNMLGDVYKVMLASTSRATDLDIRGVLTTLLPTATNIFSIDVCGDAEAANIIVGTDYWSGITAGYYFLTYRSTDSGESWIPSGTKSPTGGDGIAVPTGVDARTQVLMSPDFLTDGIAYAGTFGTDTSAFSRSKDSGAVWDQISLIDYGDVDDGYVIKDLDAAGYNADGTLHMTTQEVSETNGAIWKRTGGKNWERIWSYANPTATSDIEKLIINGDETMFAVDLNAKRMWRSSDNGATWPKKITTKPNLTEVCIVSPTTIYTGHADGSIYWSTKSGTAWQKPEDSEIPTDTPIFNIGVSGDVVLVGTIGGMVFVSSDGGETIERVGLTNPGVAGAPAAVTTDLGFAGNNIIYASIAGVPNGGIWRTEVDFDDPGSSEWLRIDDLQSDEPYDYNKVIPAGPALSLPPTGVLYVVNAYVAYIDAGDPTSGLDTDADPLDAAGGLWRCANPTDPEPYPYFEKENKGLDAGDSLGYKTVDLFPFVQFCSVSNLDKDKKETVLYYNQVVMFTDTLDTGVPLAAPTDDAAGVGTLYTGEHEVDVVLVWEKIEGATKYQWQVAIDEDFDSVVGGGFADGNVAKYIASPDSTYYWRVRVAYEATAGKGDTIGAPLISPWSEKWKFKTVIGPTVARPELEAPEAGFTDIALSPTFEWSGIAWAEKYEFELATDPGTTAGGYFATPLVSLTGANALVSTAWKCDIDLDYNTRYYWHAKAIGVDTETPWSDVGTFVTMTKPVVPPEPTAPVVIPPVEEITPAWIWAIIGIGAALVIAVIVLVITTRRVP